MIGLNFRATAIFVTDPAGTTVVTDADGTGVDITRSGITFNLSNSAFGSRDTNAAIDPRIAGYIFVAVGDGGTWTVTIKGLSAGTYNVSLAMGIDNDAQNTSGVVVHDGLAAGTTLLTISGAPAAGHFIDAGGSDRTSAVWPGSNTLVPVVITGTSITAVVTSAVNRAYLAHFSVTPAAAIPTPVLQPLFATPQYQSLVAQ